MGALEQGEDVGGGEALVAQGAEGEGVVALGEADAVFVAQEGGVEVVDGWEGRARAGGGSGGRWI